MTQITKPLPGATIDYHHPLSRGLIGWWLFNEGAGSRVADISGFGNHGTPTNIDLATAWSGSIHGGGLRTDGVDDFVTMGDPGAHWNSLITDQFSVAAWVTPEDVATQGEIGGCQDNTGTRFSGSLRTITSQFGFDLEAAGGQVRLTSGTVVNGRWYHLAGTYNSGTARFYVDGELVDTDTGTSGNVVDFDEILFGDDILKTGRPWAGTLDDARIYNRELTASDIQTLLNSPYIDLLA